LGDYAEQLIDPNEPVLFAADSDFLPGVVGLVASRLAEKYYRPAIVAEYGEHYSHGSCRSITEVHITEALDSVADLLERYGGHAQAAGFTIANERLPEFQERITDYIRRELAGKDLRPSVPVDAEIPLNEVDWALYEMLQQLEPTGYANATPIFVSRNLQPIGMRAVGTDGSHLQFTVTEGTFGRRCIAFRQGVWANAMPDRVDIAYTINLNEWRGQQNLQLMVKDVKETEGP
jgi:single-stranded-DNA-specific exonuclease